MQVEISEDGFLNLLQYLNGGGLVGELDLELIKMVQAVREHNGEAKLTLTIAVNRIKQLPTAVNISHDITVKLPKEKRREDAMFMNQHHGLVTQPQEQKTFDLQPITNTNIQKLTPIKGNVIELEAIK